MLKRMMVLAVAIALIGTACGDDDGLTESEQAIADVIASGIAEEPDAGDPFSEPEAAQCFSEGLVKNLGVARLAEIGITADSASPEEAFAAMTDGEISDMADLALGCVDIETAMAGQFAADGISDDSARCMAKGFGETDFYRLAIIAGMTGDESYDPSEDPEFLGMMISIATDCLTADELSIIMGG